MKQFESVRLERGSYPVVVPADYAIRFVRRLRDEGIDYSYHAWDEVVRGDAPIPYDEAMNMLRPFEEKG